MNSSSHIFNVGILVSPIHHWGRGIINGILAYSEEVGPWHIWTNPNEAERLDVLGKDWPGDGIIARVASKQLADDIAASGLPVVNVADQPIDGFSAPCFRTDDRTSAKMAAEHFVTRGFHNIAFVGIDRPVSNWYAEAFRQELAKNGEKCETFFFKKYSTDLQDQLLPWLQSLPKPVGILGIGTGSARLITGCCMEAGISVPHDVAVLCASYDDLMCRTCAPPLSGILTPLEQIGYQAAKALHAMMAGEQVPAVTTYIPPLGIRENLSSDTLAVADPKLAQVVEFIRDHAFDPINTSDILKAVPMSRRSLDRRFQQAFGRSLLDEIRRRRINKARQMLAETDQSMQQIAEACGLTSYNYLSNVFKKVTGMSPRAYRNQMRSQ